MRILLTFLLFFLPLSAEHVHKKKELQHIYSNKMKNWEFDKKVPSIFQYVRAAVFIDTERGIDEKSVEKPMRSKTNSSSRKGKPGPLGPGSSKLHLGGVRSPFQIIPRPSGRGSFCLSIQQGIDKILNKIDQNVHVGIEVISLETNQRLYEKNAHKLFVPASNTKLFVAGAALSALGPHFTFETALLTDGPVKENTVQGNVYLQGSGDPSFTLNDLEQLVLILRLSQIKEIQGDLIVDHFAFDSFPEGPGWMWDDIHDVSYSPMNALSINHNCLNVWVRPAEQISTPPKIFAYPKTGFVKIENHATTGEKGETLSLGRVLRMQRNTIQVKGEIGIRKGIQSFQVPIESPHLYAATLLQSVLKKAGIEWKGKMRIQKAPTHAAVLATHRSAPLSVLLHTALKNSDNLYADNLFKKVGQIHFNEQGTWQNGSKAVRNHLEQEAGLDIADLVLVDGSGLSRYNLASPHHVTSYLSWLYSLFPFSAEFLSALSLAGKDGALKNRFLSDPPLLRAKSGTMTGISALSGYLQTADGEPLAFSIFINGFTEKASFYNAEVEDPICTFLTNLSRN